MIKLITLLASGIPAIIAAIAAFIARKAGTATLAITSFGVLTIAFVACINLIFNQVLAVLTMPIWIANSVGMFMPSVFSLVVSAVWSARTCRAMFDWARYKVHLMAASN